MQFDYIIIGGGLVGASLALALRRPGINIALVDAKVPAPQDPRLLALNHSSCQLLKNLGLWSQLAKIATPIHQVHVSHAGTFGAVRLNREDLNLTELGFVVPAYYLESALYEAMLQASEITLFCPAKLTTLQQDAESVTAVITTEKGDIQLQSHLLIGADGIESTVRRLLAIPTKMHDYGQQAIVTKTTLQRSHHHIAYERFKSDSAIAMLPLPEQTCATIWTLPAERAKSLMNLSDPDFLALLQKEFGYRLGRLQQIARRYVFPLRMVQVQSPVQNRVYLLGNAAHSLHPIAAQGFNLALFEVAHFAEQLQLAQLVTLNLQKIAETVQQQTQFSTQLSHRLATLFAQPTLIKQLALPLGFVAIDIALPMKQKFLQRIMGQSGPVPSLLVGMDYHEQH